MLGLVCSWEMESEAGFSWESSYCPLVNWLKLISSLVPCWKLPLGVTQDMFSAQLLSEHSSRALLCCHCTCGRAALPPKAPCSQAGAACPHVYPPGSSDRTTHKSPWQKSKSQDIQHHLPLTACHTGFKHHQPNLMLFERMPPSPANISVHFSISIIVRVGSPRAGRDPVLHPRHAAQELAAAPPVAEPHTTQQHGFTLPNLIYSEVELLRCLWKSQPILATQRGHQKYLEEVNLDFTSGFWKQGVLTPRAVNTAPLWYRYIQFQLSFREMDKVFVLFPSYFGTHLK